MDQVEDGKIEITAHDWPSFLYDTTTIYDPDDEVTGLFRGFLLVRVKYCLVDSPYFRTGHFPRSIAIFLPGHLLP